MGHRGYTANQYLPELHTREACVVSLAVALSATDKLRAAAQGNMVFQQHHCRQRRKRPLAITSVCDWPLIHLPKKIEIRDLQPYSAIMVPQPFV